MRNEQARKILKKDIRGRLIGQWALFSLPCIVLVGVAAILSITHMHFKIDLNLNLPASTVNTSSLIPAVFTGILTACSIMVGFFTVAAYNLRHDFDNYIQNCEDSLIEVTKMKEDDAAKRIKENLILNIKAYSHQIEHIGKFLSIFFAVFFLNLIIYTFIFINTDLSQLFVVVLNSYAILFLYSSFFGSFLFLNEFMHYPEHDHEC